MQYYFNDIKINFDNKSLLKPISFFLLKDILQTIS